jgi:glycosyltransferase involved in cell wall biosynthesis
MIHYITTHGTGDAWVANELRIVESRGIPFVLHAMRAPHQHFFASEWARSLHARTRRIYPIPAGALIRAVLLAPLRFRGRFADALWNACCGRRESLRARIAALAHFFAACHWAASLRGEEVSLIHSQWVHSCGSIGMYGAWLLGVPFSFTGHAADLFRDRVALLDKVRRAEFIVCISNFHREFFRSLGAPEEKLRIAYCGIDVAHFAPGGAGAPSPRKRILAAGRLVEKKGFANLIEACRRLAERGEDFECVIRGSGPLEGELRARCERLGLDGRVRIEGKELQQEEIPRFMAQGDLFCLPCVRARDGDVDGLPQLLMEAMACGLPVVSTRLVGIPDLVVDGETGVLVESGDCGALAEALAGLLRDPARASRLAERGRAWVVEKFDIEKSLEPLIEEFKKRLPRAREIERHRTAQRGEVLEAGQHG